MLNSLKPCTPILFPLISKPTRVSKHSATLINNIFCNNINDKDIINGIFYTDISDIFPIFSINVNIKVVEERYKDYKRILNYTMKKAERDHYDVLFRLNKDNPKKT